MEFSIETEANNVANSMSNRPGVGFARRRASVDNDGSVGPVRNQERKVRPFDQERRMAALHWRSGGHEIFAARPDQRGQLQQAGGRLALQDRQPGHAARVQIGGTPLMLNGMIYATAGTRRSVIALKADTGELVWVHSEFEGQRAVNSPRQLSGRGLSSWSVGKGDDRILYVTTGYRLLALDAKTGNLIPSFGKGGKVDLKVGVVYGNGQQIDLEKGDAGLHSTPIVAGDVVIVGMAMKEGMTVVTHNNVKGQVRAFDDD